MLLQDCPLLSQSCSSERVRIMFKIADLVEQHEVEFAYLEALSMGRPTTGYFEQTLCASVFRWMSQCPEARNEACHSR